MSRSKKKNKELEPFIRYARDGMKGKERNAFERKLQRDPFEAEAAEGLSMISPEEAVEDLRILKERVSRHTAKRKPLYFMRVAAILTLLLATSAMLVIFRIDSRKPLVSENIELKETKEPVIINAPVPIIKSPGEDKNMKKEQMATGSSKKEKYLGVDVVDTEQVEQEASDFLLAEEMKEINISAEEEAVAQAQARIMPEKAKSAALPSRQITGTVISSEDNLPIPGVAIALQGKVAGVAVTDINGRFMINVDADTSMKLMANFVGMKTSEATAQPGEDMLITMSPDMQALNEVVVVGYGVQKKKTMTGSVTEIRMDDDKNPYEYVSASPETGNAEFRKYIESNLKYPASVTVRTREVVVISMIVRTTGVIDSLKVIKSPGKEFSDEAMRLIKEGPAWKPSTINGQKQDEEVKVRIVFR